MSSVQHNVRLSLIGAGWVAKQHLEVIKGIRNMEAVGITSRTRDKAEALAREYNIEVCADDMDELIEKTRPDALLILVSEDQMFAVASAALEYNLPLFLEKPAGIVP